MTSKNSGQREINARGQNFRAWDLIAKKYIGPFTMDDALNGDVEGLHPGSCDWELERGTGLHDKNGREIYEGDIVTHKSIVDNQANGYPEDDFGPKEIGGVMLNVNRNPFPIHRDWEYAPNRKVVWMTGEEGTTSRACWSPLSYWPPEDLVVIGNIHESPTLLKKETTR